MTTPVKDGTKLRALKALQVQAPARLQFLEDGVYTASVDVPTANTLNPKETHDFIHGGTTPANAAFATKVSVRYPGIHEEGGVVNLEREIATALQKVRLDFFGQPPVGSRVYLRPLFVPSQATALDTTLNLPGEWRNFRHTGEGTKSTHVMPPAGTEFPVRRVQSLTRVDYFIDVCEFFVAAERVAQSSADLKPDQVFVTAAATPIWQGFNNPAGVVADHGSHPNVKFTAFGVPQGLYVPPAKILRALRDTVPRDIPRGEPGRIAFSPDGFHPCPLPGVVYQLNPGVPVQHGGFVKLLCYLLSEPAEEGPGEEVFLYASADEALARYAYKTGRSQGAAIMLTSAHTLRIYEPPVGHATVREVRALTRVHSPGFLAKKSPTAAKPKPGPGAKPAYAGKRPDEKKK